MIQTMQTYAIASKKKKETKRKLDGKIKKFKKKYEKEKLYSLTLSWDAHCSMQNVLCFKEKHQQKQVLSYIFICYFRRNFLFLFIYYFRNLI